MNIVAKLIVGREERELSWVDLDYYRMVKPNGKPCSRAEGGFIAMRFVPQSNDDFFLEWMFADRMEDTKIDPRFQYYTTKDGAVVFYEGDFEGRVLFKYEFEEGVPIHYQEAFSNEWGMEVFMVISAPIQKFRSKAPFVKLWYEKWSPPEEKKKPVEEKKPPVVLITNVNGKKEVIPEEEVTYKVTGFNLQPTEEDKKRIRWVVKVDDKKVEQSQKGKTLKLKIKKEWAGKEIMVMPYLQKPTDRVSVKTKVEKCNHKDGARNVASYIVKEIKNNTHSNIAGSIRYYASYEEYEKRVKEWENRNILGQLLSQPEPPNLLKARILWTERVFKNRPWDHKPIIRDNFKKFAIERREYSNVSKQYVTYKSYFHKYGEYDYFYDVWSNIHYGYVGLSVGFDENTLLDGADLAQIIDSFGGNSKDTEDDKIAIKIGFSLYYKYGKYAEKLTAQDILDALEIAPLKESKKKHKCYENK